MDDNASMAEPSTTSRTTTPSKFGTIRLLAASTTTEPPMLSIAVNETYNENTSLIHMSSASSQILKHNTCDQQESHQVSSRHTELQ